MRLENDDGLSELLASGEETRLCTGFEFTEGPIWVAADEALLFSDIPGNRIHRWRPGSDAAEVYREPSGHSNGLTLDADGQLLACEHSGRRVSRATYVARGGDGAGTDVVAAFEGKRFNSPNDLVMHSSGRLYFTDPTYGLPRPGARRVMGNPDARKELDFQGVYLFDADGTLTLLVDEFTQPNGLVQPGDSALLRHGVAKLEREKGFEPSTLCSGSRGATARVAPPPNDLMLNFFSTLRLAIGGSNACFRRRAE